MKNEIKPLTGVRGLAAFMVMLYHIQWHARQNQDSTFLDTLPLNWGYLCVDLFFVLSGFVLALRYSEDFKNGCVWPRYASFMVNRIARIYPVYFVVTAIFYAKWLVNISGVHDFELSAYDLIANFLLIHSWGLGAHIMVGNSWSVSTELLAYSLFPLLIYIAFSRWVWLQVLASVVGIFMVAVSSQGEMGPLDVVNLDAHKYSFLPALRCLGEFCLGLGAYRLSQNSACRRLMSGDGAVLVTLALLIGLLAIPGSDVAVVLVIPFLIISLYYNSRASAVLFGNRVIYHLGLISYSLYLWHGILVDVIKRCLKIVLPADLANADMVFAPAVIVAAWLVAWASYALIEVRGRRRISAVFRKLFSSASPQAVPQTRGIDSP